MIDEESGKQVMTDTHIGGDEQWEEFLHRLVHDLREPLRSINAFSELLAEIAKSRLGAEGDQVLGEIYTGASRMRVVLDGLAAYSLALGESSVRGSSVLPASLQSAFKIVVAGLDAQIRACGARVAGAGFSNTNPKLDIGLERLLQLLENLIGNSLRFRSEATPDIQVSAGVDPSGMWAISVEDNGIGIAPEDCEAIFKPFMRVEGRKYGGTGLGLSICRKIVEAHGGSIRMEAAPRGGAICTFTLPEA